ncbi:hypothetical protein BG005_002930 [Podila minutissima]|nr:hypothetical protein BG005_002930 [Podila minutissima]
MSSLELIRQALVELVDDMNGENPDNVDSQAAATNICNMALADVKPKEADMVTSLLFNPDQGIVYFLKKSLDKSAHIAAKVIFLEFTAEYISRSPSAMTHFIKVCLSLFLNDQSAKVKRAAILPIKILLPTCCKVIDPLALDINTLFTKLYTVYATQQAKTGSTVKAEILELMGIIARYYPKSMEDRSATLMRWCLTVGQDQLKPGAKVDMSHLAGALIGLDNCLYSFSDKITRDIPLLLQLVKKLVNVPDDMSRYAVPIAALDLFTHHVQLFRANLIDVYEWMYHKIAGFCAHPASKMHKCGFAALDVFLKEFFTTNFTQILRADVISSGTQYKAMSVAIRGYGYFAAPCKKISPDQLPSLLSYLLSKSGFLVSSNVGDSADGSSSHLSAFITAYTYVARVYDEIPELLMTALNQMTNAAVVNFTKMSAHARIDSTLAIEKLLIMLFYKGEGVLRTFFDRLSYKLLVFTSSDISKPTMSPTAQQDLVGDVWHSYTTYLFLWQNIFTPSTLSKDMKLSEVLIEGNDKEVFLRTLYASMMLSFKRLVSLLNLSVSDAQTDLEDDDSGPKIQDIGAPLAPASGDVGKMQANNAKDFTIFQNLTEFWQKFLPKTCPELFGRWAFLIGDCLIELSAKNPLVSGFYKMFATCLQVCQSTQHFGQQSNVPKVKMEGTSSQVEIQRTKSLFSKYIAEVLARLEQYKDDLLAACLHLVLSSPTALTDSNSIASPIQLALKLGLGYFPLASVGLEAIERWIVVVDQDPESWFRQVLPSLNQYLMVQVPGSATGDVAQEPSKKAKISVKTDKSSTYISILKNSSAVTSDQIQSLQELQLRILHLLGQQAKYNKLILSDSSDSDDADKKSSELLAWDPEPRVKFKIPFQEMKTELQFDELLPRIVDLAENSLNRQIKVASCELLHSLVILMIGSSAFRARDAQDPKKSPFHKIYLRVFPALFRLAVDVDRVPRSLFRPLVSQLIHWLTNSAQYENPETVVLLNCCMDAACDSLGPLRDYGAECLGEFVKWSIKQTAVSQSSVNIKSLLKRVYNLASHSVPAKRLGASLIINRIYRTFREEAVLVNQFTFELLYWMLFSLRSAEVDHAGLGTRQQACASILHLQRIIQKKADLFLRDSRDRRRFPGLEQATLEALVLWLMKETARSEVEYTKMCRTLLDSFIKLLPGSSSTGAWIAARLQRDPKFLSTIYSGPERDSKTFTVPESYQAWCSQLASILTNYTWLLQHTGNSERLTEHLKASPILALTSKFLEKCLLLTENILSQEHKETALTPQERRKIREQNFITVRKSIAFFTALISKDTNGSLVQCLQESHLLGTQFYTVFATCLFDPDSIGNDELLKSEDEIQALSAEMQSALWTLGKQSTTVLRELGKALASTIFSEDLNPLTLSPGELHVRDAIKSKAILDGLILLLRCQTIRFMFGGSGSKTNDFIEQMFKTFMPLQSTQDPLWIQYCSALLHLTLADRECHKELWRVILDVSKVDEGLMTYQKYSHEINRQLALHFRDVSEQLAGAATASNSSILSIWNNFLDFLFAHPELSNERSGFLDMLTSNFSLLKAIVDTLVRDQPSMTISIWRRLVALNPRILRISKSPDFVNYFFAVFQSFFERHAATQEFLSLPVMSEAFSILPVFLSYDGPTTEEFEKVFARALMTVIPSNSAEYERGSARFKDYISSLDMLLKSLVASTNISLFKLLMGIAIRESEHPHMEQIQQSMASFALKLPLSKFLETTNFCFESFVKRSHSDEHRRNIVHQILLPILKIVPPLSVCEFFVANIVQIIEVMKQDPSRTSDAEIRRDFIERECAYALIHILYMRLPADMVNTKESRIVEAFTKGKAANGKELTVEVFKTANTAKFKQDSTSLSPEAGVLRENFKRSAYNALAAAILCTQRKEDFFRQFLFRDNEAKKEYVWENIVDLNAQYHFNQVLEGPMIRTKLSDLRSRSLDPSKSSGKYQYMSSQYLRDSSLSQSVGIIDSYTMFTESKEEDRITSQASQQESSGDNGAIMTKSVQGPEVDLMLELDAINANPCMKMILLVVNELHTSITPPPADMTTEDGQMPSWMKDIHRKLINPNTHLNVRLLLAKVIVNMPQAFEAYANSWVRPMMKLAIEGESYGDAMSYFVQDLCVLIVVWGESVKLSNTYEDRVLLLNFLSYLMKNCYHDIRSCLLNNIDLIKGVFENWSDIAVVPTTIIFDNFKNAWDEKKNITGIQLLGIVLTHDNPPFYNGDEIDLGTLTEKQYYEALVRNMTSNVKPVYTSAAEVSGLILSYMKKRGSTDETFLDLVTSKLNDLWNPPSRANTSKNPIVSFINCVHKIQLNYPEITDTFGGRVLFHFSQLLGDERTLALEILAGRADHLENLFQSLQGLNFLGCLKHKDEKTQFAALSVIYGLRDILREDQIQYFLDTLVAEFSSHSSIECRKFYYSILMVLFEKFASSTLVGDTIRTQLLRGLGDSSESIRRTVVEFWYGGKRLPLSILDRLRAIMENMYDPQAEDMFLYYATYMLLDRTKHSSDYNEPIFPESLPNAKFSENYAHIDTSWRDTAAMTPLFVHTQQSQVADNVGALGADELRATQATFEFSMTMDGGTQGIRSQLGGQAGTSSALLFKSGPNSDHAASSTQEMAAPSQKYQRLQHRNTNWSTSITTSRFVRAYEVKTQQASRVRADKELAKTRSVAMIRRYRDGDLPDIQISYADILRPLQNLAEMDVDICRMLFSKLVTGLLHQVSIHSEKTEEEASVYTSDMMLCFRRMLERSTLFYTPFIGCVLRVCHDYGKTNIPAGLIARTSMRSSNQHLGIVLIEKQVQAIGEEERPVKRQRTAGMSASDQSRATWNELAKVYKSVDEKDIYKSIFENKVATTEFTKRAIEAEVVGDFEGAGVAYFDGIMKLNAEEIEIDDAEQNIWANGRLEALEALGNWDILEKNMVMDLEGDPEKVWTDEYVDPYLHYYLTSYIKLVNGRTDEGMLEPWSSENPNPLFGFLSQAMNEPERRQLLTSQYQPELALAAIVGKDFKQASYYVRKSYDKFLSTWAHLHPLSDKPRLHELSGLQRVVEMDEFLTSMDEAHKSSTANPVLPLLTKWEGRFPGKTTDTVRTWGNVRDDRNLMIRRLEDTCQLSRRDEDIVVRHQIRYLKQMSAAARSQGNMSVADDCIAEMRDLSASTFDIREAELKKDLVQAARMTDPVAKALALVEVVSQCHQLPQSSSFGQQQAIELNLLGCKAYSLLTDAMLDDSQVLQEVRSQEWVRRNVGSAGKDLVQALQEKGFDLIQSIGELKSDDRTQRKLRLTTARYCDKILRHAENQLEEGVHSSTDPKSLLAHAELVISQTLLAMKEGDQSASELFPRLLQLIEIYPETQKMFTELVSDFPHCWIFVRWIQQMVAILNKRFGTCVMPIMRSIAVQYPNALFYPLTISIENFTFEENSYGRQRKEDVKWLSEKTRSDLKDDFIFELRRLTNTDHLLKDWLEQTIALFQSKYRNKSKVKVLFQDLHKLILDVNNPRLGSIAKSFAAKFGAKLESLCGKDGSRLADISNKDFNSQILKFCRNEILGKDASPRKSGEADLLKSYSPWLHAFQSSDFKETMEIPGQYTGSSPPVSPATIVRFDPRVLVMSSIRKPKRISILGSDEKEHLFLVKGGEDLRLDQRIQQLFSLMNDIMAKDPQCSRQKIQIGTYKVIPMSGSLGILEWVDNTKPLRHCIEGEIVRKDLWKKSQEKYSKFVASFKGDMMGYHNLFTHGTRQAVVAKMDELYADFREPYLRQSIARLAASPEAFLMLRSEFAKSLAAINVCSYVLGIGDRHLENFLLDMSTGCLIPIDFGHAFGSATEVLPVPELAPFRLTRQLELFLQPLGNKGLLEHPMVCIMKALQLKKEVILNTMDVFVKEPLLDWRKFAINQAKELKKQGADMDEFSIDEESTAPPVWYLQQKLDIARKKLERYNPSYLTVQELKMGHANKPFLNALCKTARGDPHFNVRAKEGKVCSSVQAQVQCLIDMASDKDVLGRAWVGWMSWV